jgi:hypothetical protein
VEGLPEGVRDHRVQVPWHGATVGPRP